MVVALAAAAVFALLAARRANPAISRPLLLLSGCVNLVLGYVVLFAFGNN